MSAPGTGAGDKVLTEYLCGTILSGHYILPPGQTVDCGRNTDGREGYALKIPSGSSLEIPLMSTYSGGPITVNGGSLVVFGTVDFREPYNPNEDGPGNPWYGSINVYSGTLQTYSGSRIMGKGFLVRAWGDGVLLLDGGQFSCTSCFSVISCSRYDSDDTCTIHFGSDTSVSATSTIKSGNPIIGIQGKVTRRAGVTVSISPALDGHSTNYYTYYDGPIGKFDDAYKRHAPIPESASPSGF
ncbi:MAG: hypothetical protein DRO99_02830 [Candidatus Aenigmatarchaeota archaeon]|mgnify:CR=1 FL=1|nr:MAG: hypothetical protein DRO99_02830 [Candidatus Aenigmarchaeota archaeon]